jgi:hypothetical protein
MRTWLDYGGKVLCHKVRIFPARLAARVKNKKAGIRARR